MYTSSFLGGRFQIGSKYQYTRLSQKSASERYTPYQHNEFLSTGIYWTTNGFVIFPGIGLSVNNHSNGTSSNTTASPFAQIYTGWYGSGKLQGLNANLTLAVMADQPSLSRLTESYTYIDRWMVATGNPELQRYWHTRAQLEIAYYNPNGRDKICIMISPQYNHNRSFQTIYNGNGMIMLYPHPIRNDFRNEIDLTGSWYPFKWLEISPYVELSFWRFDTPNQHVRESYLRAGGSIALSFNKWEMVLAANSPTRNYAGDIKSRSSAQYAAIVQYKHRGWSFGAEYHYFGVNEFSKIDTGTFRYLDRTDWKPLRYLCQLTATYSFSVGRARRHAGKMLNASSSESGLNSWQKPRDPK